LIFLAIPAAVAGFAQTPQADAPGKDLRLSYRSVVDGTQQPYRVYVPSSYDGSREIPLVFALHGTGENENTFFEEPRIPPGTIKRLAEKYGVLLVSPLGRGTTEYRGTGENDVLSVLVDVEEHYRIDPDRVYLMGQSMGGTGSAYLALHHPDLFAAVAPLAAAYSFPWLAANAGHVPFWWISGADDAKFYHQGVMAGVERMRQLGVPVRLDMLPGEGHPGGLKHLDEVFAWLLEHRRAAHPRQYVFEVDTPLHGRAYWTDVEAIAAPGKMAVVKARADGKNRAQLNLENVAALAFFPDPQDFDPAGRMEVAVDDKKVFSGAIAPRQELEIQGGAGKWRARLRPRREYYLTAFRTHPVAVAPKALTMQGTEPVLADWIADAMRHATGADIAIFNRMHYRGLPIPAGKVDIVDLIECNRPFDQYLVTAELSGSDLLQILDANVPDAGQFQKQPVANRLVQLSGAHYVFDPGQPEGRRIVSSDLEPNRRYTVVMEGQVVQRETILLAGRFEKLSYKTADVPFTLALYGYAASRKRIEAPAGSRVRQAGASGEMPGSLAGMGR
jgi:predicted esterase